MTIRSRSRAAALFTGVTLLAGCSRESPAPSAAETQPAASQPTVPLEQALAGRLYVTNESSGDLSVVDVATMRVVATIPLGKRPRGIRLSPDKSTLYVALSGSPLAPPGVDESTLPPPDKKADGIGVVDVKTGKLLRVIPGGSDPEQLAVSRDGKWLFVANEDVAQASVIEVDDGKVIATIPVGEEPEGVEMRPDGKVVYVTSEETGEVFVIDAVAPRLITKFTAGPRPRSTGFLPDNRRAYVGSENGSSVLLVDAVAHKVLKTIKLTGPMVRPMGVVASPDGRYVFVTTGRGKGVVIIDTATDTPVGSIEAGERPWGIAVSPDGATVFTANGPSNDVSFIDVATRRVTAKVKVGDRPWGVAFVP
jgi:YVTN family beta-propeller protein